MKEFKAINAGKNKINLSHLDGLIDEVKPIEIHLKEDGDINSHPSFCIVMMEKSIGLPRHYFGQISLKMLNESLKNIGYEIKKI